MLLPICFSLLFSVNTYAQPNSAALMKKFKALGGDPLSLKQALCFLYKYRNSTFEVKKVINSGFSTRCNQMENGAREISINRSQNVAIVDYVKSSKWPRKFLIV